MNFGPDQLTDNRGGTASATPRKESVFDTQTWHPEARQPLSPRGAYSMEFVHGAQHVFVAEHGVPLWLSKLLMPAMLADLALTGEWSFGHQEGQFVLRSYHGHSLCHGLVIKRRTFKVVRYEAHHSDADCPRPAPQRPPRDAELWLGPPGDKEISVSSVQGWRILLHTASRQRVRLTRKAVEEYTHLNSGRYSSPQTLTHDYLAAADRLAKVSSCVPTTPGHHRIVDATDPNRYLRWKIEVQATGRTVAHSVTKARPKATWPSDDRAPRPVPAAEPASRPERCAAGADLIHPSAGESVAY